jgi:phospholipase C
VISTEFDHTSLLKYLTDLWGLGPLTERVKQARSFSGAIRSSPRTDTPNSVPMPPLVPLAGRLGVPDEELAEPLNEHQKALLVFCKHLEKQTAGPATTAVLDMGRVASGPLVEFQMAKQRVVAFLNQQKAKAAAGLNE